MQTIFFPKEVYQNENRAAATPSTVKKLVNLGFNVLAEKYIGRNISINDAAYSAAGAKVVDDFGSGAMEADFVIRIKCSSAEEISKIKAEALHISFLDKSILTEEIEAFKRSNVKAISLEMIPRSTIAQKFDVLSSQTNLAGYAAVLIAATNIDKAFPMMMTPAGTISPVNVFIIGVGVAGLQAIATAKRLGARVEAFDTRPEVEDQVKSLGAKFLKIDIGETGKTDQGYAKSLTEEQIQKQRESMIASCKKADIVITTAKVFGRKAPVLITKAMLDQINSQTLFVDMAVLSGGNVEGSVADELLQYNDHLRILGISEGEQAVAASASQMFSENMYNFIEHFYNKEAHKTIINAEDEIISRCLITA